MLLVCFDNLSLALRTIKQNKNKNEKEENKNGKQKIAI